MAIVRVTKEFSFEMAHALWNYDGPCRNVHGHSYRLFVTLYGKPSEKAGNGVGLLLVQLVFRNILVTFETLLL